MLLKCPFALLRGLSHGLYSNLKTSRNGPQLQLHQLHPLLDIKRDNSSKVTSIGHNLLPTRKELLQTLQKDQFDVLIIGGGAIGCGCALEAASRGLKTALIESEDFGSGASGKTSKLFEGSESFMRAAVQGADLEQMFMLQQVMDERAILMAIAPHLTRVQPMMMPIYKPLHLSFYWLGLKLYDAMAREGNARGSHFLSRDETLNEFPLLRNEGLLGSLVYYDGQLDDARMCLALALTALKHGATVTNYVQLKMLKTMDENRTRLAIVKDKINHRIFKINTKCVINATGENIDVIRKLDNIEAQDIMIPTTSTHIALPSYFGSSHYGLLFPSNQPECSQAKIMMPFESQLVMGSIQLDPAQFNDNLANQPSPSGQAVQCLLDETRDLLESCVQLRPDHVLSAWTGVKNTINKDVSISGITSNFLLEISKNGMITLAGGRWSIYRTMASDAIDAAIEEHCLEPKVVGSCTQNLLLDGAEDYYCLIPVDLVQRYNLSTDVAQHLCQAYGSNAVQLLQGTQQADRQRLHPKFPYIVAEVDYACQREYACELADVIARRLRAAFVDAMVAQQMLPTVLKIMARNNHWQQEEQVIQYQKGIRFLIREMGLGYILHIDREALVKSSKAAGADSNSIYKTMMQSTRDNITVKSNESKQQYLLERCTDDDEGTADWLNDSSKVTRGTIYCATEKYDSKNDPKKESYGIGFKPPKAKPDKKETKPAPINKPAKATAVGACTVGSCKQFTIRAKQGDTIDVTDEKNQLGHVIVKSRDLVEKGVSHHNMSGFGGLNTKNRDAHTEVKGPYKGHYRVVWPNYRTNIHTVPSMVASRSAQFDDRICRPFSRSLALSRRTSRSTFSDADNLGKDVEHPHRRGCVLRGIRPMSMFHSEGLSRGICSSVMNTTKIENPGSYPSKMLEHELKALGVTGMRVCAVCSGKSNQPQAYIEITVKKNTFDKLSEEVKALRHNRPSKNFI